MNKQFVENFDSFTHGINNSMRRNSSLSKLNSVDDKGFVNVQADTTDVDNNI